MTDNFSIAPVDWLDRPTELRPSFCRFAHVLYEEWYENRIEEEYEHENYNNFVYLP